MEMEVRMNDKDIGKRRETIEMRCPTCGGRMVGHKGLYRCPECEESEDTARRY
jgi:tRNA(Ile2) C34 agmatinyltransferase TiaS